MAGWLPSRSSIHRRACRTKRRIVKTTEPAGISKVVIDLPEREPDLEDGTTGVVDFLVGVYFSAMLETPEIGRKFEHEAAGIIRGDSLTKRKYCAFYHHAALPRSNYLRRFSMLDCLSEENCALEQSMKPRLSKYLLGTRMPNSARLLNRRRVVK